MGSDCRRSILGALRGDTRGGGSIRGPALPDMADRVLRSGVRVPAVDYSCPSTDADGSRDRRLVHSTCHWSDRIKLGVTTETSAPLLWVLLCCKQRNL